MGRRTEPEAAAQASGKPDLAKLVQSRISKDAHARMEKKIAKKFQTPAAYIRELIYIDLGLMKKGA